MKNIIISIVILGLSGCASTIYKGGCGSFSTAKNTVPYTFGTADGGLQGCYLACIGSCKTPNYDAIKEIMTSYFNAAKPNTLTTPDGSTVMVIPAVKK